MGLVAAVQHLWHTRLRSSARARDVSDAVITLLLGLVLVLVGVVGLWGSSSPDAGADVGRWVHVVTLLAGCTVMLVKRRRPVLALGGGVLVFVVDVWFGGSIGLVLVLFDLLYSAAMFAGGTAVQRLRAAIGVAVVGTLVVTWALTGEVQPALFLGLQVFAVLGTPLWWGLAVRRQTELAEMAEARAEDLRRLAAMREAEAVAQERSRMARDLHDAIAGNLSAIAIHAEAALAGPPGSASRSVTRERTALEAIRSAGVASLAEMRSMILLLRSGDDGTTAPARLREVGELLATARATGLDARWDGPAPDALPLLPAAVDQAAYRILQEALTNAAKHAPGAQVLIRVRADDAHLDLEVTNEGSSIGPVQPGRTGWGLVTMRERAEAVGGRFRAGWDDHDADGAASGRWSVRAALPLEVPEVSPT